MEENFRQISPGLPTLERVLYRFLRRSRRLSRVAAERGEKPPSICGHGRLSRMRCSSGYVESGHIRGGGRGIGG